MPFNLGAPGNETLAMVAQCQKQASFWIWQWRRGQIGRGDIEIKLAALPAEAQAETRKWLNHFRDKQ